MAFCPKCNGEMRGSAIACPHCGYDFDRATADLPPRKDGLAYSALADVALLVSGIAAGVGCMLAIVVGIGAIVNGSWLVALVYSPLAFLLQLGMLVVFLRIQNV